MFPFQRGDELVIEFSNSPHHQQPQKKISQDLILEDHAYLDVNDSDKKFSNTKSNKVLFHGPGEKNHASSNDQKKKMVHREIERQRRQEMATLYASLRSQLPLEFIKGKRSISDHMNEAVNYIKNMQNNIKQFGAKRDELKKLSNSKLENHDREHSCSSFTVHESNGIVAIEISSGIREEGLTLSKLLKLLIVEETLEVVSCLSTKVNDRLLHSIQCEVKNSNSVDLSELRRKLANVIPSLRCCD